MHGFNDRFYETLTQKLQQVEQATSADVVVAIEPWSGNYRDVDFAFGMGLSLVGIAALLYTPWDYPAWTVLVDALAFFAAGAWLCHAAPPLRRLFTSSKRREAQVQAAAAAEFHDANIWITHRRTALLIYVSLLEKELLVLADSGIAAAMGDQAWKECVDQLRSFRAAPKLPDHLVSGLDELGKRLAATLPSAESNPHEIADIVVHPVHHAIGRLHSAPR